VRYPRLGGRKPTVGLAVVFALLGVLLLTGYVRSAADKAASREKLVSVLVVASPVPRGTPAADLALLVRTERVPARVRARGGVTRLSELGDRVTAVDLVAGEQLVAARFVAPGAGTPALVPEGMMEVTVALEPERALGGQLAPGRLVAVLASFGGGGSGEARTEVVRREVLVTNVQAPQTRAAVIGREPDEELSGPPVPGGKVLVTLAVDAPTLDRVVFAAEHGGLWLSALSRLGAASGPAQGQQRVDNP